MSKLFSYLTEQNNVGQSFGHSQICLSLWFKIVQIFCFFALSGKRDFYHLSKNSAFMSDIFVRYKVEQDKAIISLTKYTNTFTVLYISIQPNEDF